MNDRTTEQQTALMKQQLSQLLKRALTLWQAILGQRPSSGRY